MSIPGVVDASTSRFDEDCLYLNVWTPDLGGRRPVVVWIYGGGFESGSASPPLTDFAAFSRMADVVVVAVNYRVGALGFLHLTDIGGADWAGSANLGLQDQVAALRWVKANVHSFGGDPGRVTVAGQSAGAFSIGSLLAAPAAEGTFERAILSSGSAERVFDRSAGTILAAEFLKALGLASPDDLRAVPVEDIVAAQGSVTDRDIGRRNLPGGWSWGVVLDGTVLPAHPRDAVMDGRAKEIGLLIGATRDELRLFELMHGAAYVPAGEAALLAEFALAGVQSPERLLAAYRRREPEAGLAAVRTMFLTDAIYRRPAISLATAQRAAGGHAHTFLFSAATMGAELGACHCADLMLLMDGPISGDPRWAAVRDEFVAAWAAFAATGDPGWPAYDPAESPNTRQFGGVEAMVVEPPADGVTAAWLRRG
jgi:para-nitrobenzyl esterase